MNLRYCWFMTSQESTGLTFNILFICSGNVCRSPMAEASLKSRVPADLKSKLHISSAGLSTLSGLAPTVEAELSARLKNYDLSAHRSLPATEVLLDKSDLILCMEKNQVKAIQTRMPHIANRVHLISDFGGKHGRDIPDPYGSNIALYKEILNLIDAELTRIEPMIWTLARKKVKPSKKS
jgi:protein-tyrosine phosphatase